MSARIAPSVDPAEVEADQIADRVIQRAVKNARPVSHGVQGAPRKGGACESDAQDEATGDIVLGGGTSSSGALSVVPDPARSPVEPLANSSGRPLDRETRSLFEPRFGTDLDQVRVHTESNAGESAGSVNAKPYTLGGDLVFGSGRYEPKRTPGDAAEPLKPRIPPDKSHENGQNPRT